MFVKWLLLVLGVGGASLISCIAAQIEGTSKTTTENGIQLEVALFEKGAADGAPELVVRLINNRSDAISLVHVNGVYELGIRVRDETGNEPQKTELGRARIPPGIPEKRVVQNLDPGRLREWRIPLAKIFELKKVKYAVSVSIEASDGSFVISAHDLALFLK